MSIFRALISFPMDSAFPRDEVTYNPHYNGTDAQALANALKANLIAHGTVGGNPFRVKIYDAKKAPPSYPLAIAEQQGTTPSSSHPRELALCLSYYAQYNRPTFRGRIYLSTHHLGTVTAGLRPTQADRDAALSWKQVFGAGLPPGTFWCVYSKRTTADSQVTNVWVDDEWDIQRRRGLRGTARSEGTVP